LAGASGPQFKNVWDVRLYNGGYKAKWLKNEATKRDERMMHRKMHKAVYEKGGDLFHKRLCTKISFLYSMG
jgi:hypothetical protein